MTRKFHDLEENFDGHGNVRSSITGIRPGFCRIKGVDGGFTVQTRRNGNGSNRYRRFRTYEDAIAYGFKYAAYRDKTEGLYES